MSGHTRRNHKEYSADHKKARKLYKSGWPVGHIAARLGLTVQQVRKHTIDLKPTLVEGVE